MNNVSKSAKTLMVIGLLTCSFAIISWQKADNKGNGIKSGKHITGDTSKPGKHDSANDEIRVAELDKAIQNLDIQLDQLNVQLDKMDFSKIEKQVNEALAKVDFTKIKLEAEKAVKNIDWNKIKLDVDNALKEAQISLKELNSEKLKKEIEEANSEIDNENLKIKINAEKIRKDAEQGMKKAKAEIEKVKSELKNYQEFTDALEQNGLINKKNGYKIKVQDGELYINGNKQPKETYEKYKEFYKKDKFSLSSDGDNVSSL